MQNDDKNSVGGRLETQTVEKECLKPFVLWFTGLSGAGKSTLADLLHRHLKEKDIKVERLDGDTVRLIFPNTGFSKEERDNHVKRIGFLASMLERNDVAVIASFISPYKDSRNFVRGLCKNFVEVYVKASVEACECRDVKGLYKKAREGKIQNFTGISDPYEAPERPEIVIETEKESIDESLAIIKDYLNKHLLEAA